ncbi:MAG: serine/threonine-protein kinase [candidate division WOR-3 bacterium]|nr:serine/threonine-protein kinase [candidate division WOR-3 bacterium]
MNSDSLRPRIPGLKDSVPGAAYKKGDVIGQKYEVYGVLGTGGCGIVYLVYSHETKGVYALKTFRDEYLADAGTRERFRKEASVWVDLERHPYLVRAYLVDDIAGRLFIGLEHIAPDEQGLNSLEGYLRLRPPDLAQSLRWAIQFCHGMEYAYSKGIRCHRDIKPANIMIGQGKTVRITDFGLAGVLGPAQAMSGIGLSIQQGTVGLSGQTVEGTGFGTPTHMPPEQFTDAASCDERSDIYAFGVVLFQMASSGRPPFLAELPTDNSEAESARFWREMHRLHSGAPVPRLDSPLFAIIQLCLEKEPGKRYQSFGKLRGDIEPLLKRQTGETVRPPELRALEVWEWGNKGVSLNTLGRCEEAIRCFDKALELDPQEALAWDNKGSSLDSLGRYEEAIRCYDKALELDPRNAAVWYNKGLSLDSLDRYEEAIHCHDKALELDPRFALAWCNKGNCLSSLGHYEEAVRSYDKALELDPRKAGAWDNKGFSLNLLGRYDDAIRCFDKALELDPRYASAWLSKGASLHELGRHEEALSCFDKALELDPRYASAWYGKALDQEKLGRRQDAVRSYKQFIALASAKYAKQVECAQQRIRELEGLMGERSVENPPDLPKRKKWGWLRHFVSKEFLAALHMDALARRFRRYPKLSGPGWCYWCRHYLGASYERREWVLRCRAFPLGIPNDIRDRRFEHTQKHPAQVEETLYEAIDFREMPDRFDKVHRDMTDGLAASLEHR